jgi:hypothetical protein
LKSDYYKKYKILFMKKTKKLILTIVTILIGLFLAGCIKNEPKPGNNIVGEWYQPNIDGVIYNITENEIQEIVVNQNNDIYSTSNYKWLYDDSLEIIHNVNSYAYLYKYTTRNKVIFHTNDTIFIDKYFLSDAAVVPQEYSSITLVRLKKVEIASFKVSDCKNAQETNTITNDYNPKVNVKTIGNSLSINIIDILFNCGLEELIKTISIENNVINIDLTETGDPLRQANCICNYDVEMLLEGLIFGTTYTLNITKNSEIYVSFNVTFAEDTNINLILPISEN